MKKRSNITLGPGASSLILMFVVLTLAVLGMLSLMTSRNDLRLSQRSAEVISAVYGLQEQAEECRASLAAFAAGADEEQLPEGVRLEEGRFVWEESDSVRVLRCAVAAEPGVPWLQHVLETTIGDGFEDLEDMDEWEDDSPEEGEAAWN